MVHFYGGPGTGKSTTNSLVFGKLKQRDRNVEIAPEVAKELTWESRHQALGFQPYVIAKQMWRMRRLDGQVEAVLTDTSTLFALIYGSERDLTPEFRDWIVSDYKRMRTLNILLKRDPSVPYEASGRNQTEEDAQALDMEIENLLIKHDVPYHTLIVDTQDSLHVEDALVLIEARLAGTEAASVMGRWGHVYYGERFNDGAM